MGFSPDQVRKMAIGDFYIISEGYAVANGAKKKAEVISDEDLSALGIEGAG